MSEKSGFLTFLQQGLEQHSKKETLETLGDRSTYIGGSDLGSCPRNVYLSKLFETTHSLKEHIIFARGHIAETIVSNALTAKNVSFSTQVRVESREKSYLKAHLDFLVHFKNEDILLEVKSVTNMPDTPRESWLLQVQYGLGLLRESGNTKCTRGYIVCFDVNSGETRDFPFNFSEEYYKLAKERAEFLYTHIRDKQEPHCETSPLCSFCKFSDTCQSFGKGAVKMNKEIEEEMMRYVVSVENCKEADSKKKALERAILDFMLSAEIEKIKLESKTLLLKNRAGRESLDTKRLKLELPEIYQQYAKKGDDTKYLAIV